MGIFDSLKKALAPEEPPFRGMEPQCVRYGWFTMDLPAGWQFTQADNRRFAVSGPGSCYVEVEFMHPRGFSMSAFDKHRETMLQIMRRSVQSPSAKEKHLMTGVMWVEATDVQENAQRQRIALFNSRPRNPEDHPPPVLTVTCTLPGTSAGAAFDAERTEPFCEALRSIKWN